MAVTNKGDKITIKLSAESEAMLKAIPMEFWKGVVKGSKKAILFVEEKAKKDFSGSNQLNVRSGYLRRSINSSVKVEGNKVIGAVGASAIYAAIHEFGGTITARASDYLKFSVGGNFVSVKQVIIPPRPYLRPAIDKSKPSIKEIIQNSITRELT